MPRHCEEPRIGVRGKLRDAAIQRPLYKAHIYWIASLHSQ